MATENYTPYSGFFGKNGQIETTLDWFDGAEELLFLWCFKDGRTESMTMSAATNAGTVTVSGNTVRISRLKLDKESAESVFVYRTSSLRTKAVELPGGAMPLSAILTELEEHRRAANDSKVEANKSIRVPEWDADTHLPPKEARAGKVMGFDDEGNPTVGEDCKQVKELYAAQKNCEQAANRAGVYADEAKQWAELAGTHSFDANASVAAAAELADKAAVCAKTAEGQVQKVKEAGEKAVAGAEKHSGEAEALDKNIVGSGEIIWGNEREAHKATISLGSEFTGTLQFSGKLRANSGDSFIKSFGETISLRLAAESALEFNDENANIGWWDDAGTWTEWGIVNDYTYDSASGVLTLTVPEPSAFGLLVGLGVLSLAASRRKRR